MNELSAVAIEIGKGIGVFLVGIVSINIPEIDYFKDLLIDEPLYNSIKNVISIIAGAVFFWKSIAMMSSREANIKADTELKTYDLLKNQEKDKSERVEEAIKELTSLIQQAFKKK